MINQTQTAKLIREYISRSIAEDFSAEENAPALLLAVQDAINNEEVCHLGRALLARHDSLVDGGYEVGGELCDPHIQAIADALTASPEPLRTPDEMKIEALRAGCQAVLDAFPALDGRRIENIKRVCRAALIAAGCNK